MANSHAGRSQGQAVTITSQARLPVFARRWSRSSAAHYRQCHWRWRSDRKSVVEGKRVDLGGRRIIKKKREGATLGGGQASLLNEKAPELGEIARRALATLQVDAAIHLDDLLEKVEDTSPSELIAALFELEMLGLVKQLPGKNFVKVW